MVMHQFPKASLWFADDYSHLHKSAQCLNQSFFDAWPITILLERRRESRIEKDNCAAMLISSDKARNPKKNKNVQAFANEEAHGMRKEIRNI